MSALGAGLSEAFFPCLRCNSMIWDCPCISPVERAARLNAARIAAVAREADLPSRRTPGKFRPAENVSAGRSEPSIVDVINHQRGAAA